MTEPSSDTNSLHRDRVSVFWPQLSSFLVRALKTSSESEMLSERVISAIFRLAIRFVPRIDSTSEQIMVLLRHILMNCEPSFIQKKCTAIALTSFINSCHRDIHRVDDWSLIFDYLLCVGIGCHPRDLPVRQTSSPGPVQGEVDTQSEPSQQATLQPVASSLQPQSVASTLQPQSVASSPPVPSVHLQIEDDTNEDVPQQVIPSAPPLEQHQSPDEAALKEQDAGRSVPSESCEQKSVPGSPVEQRKKSPPRLPSEAESTNGPNQPFIPGSSAVRDVEAYKKCVEILTVIIKEILPKSVQTNPKSDAAINQMAIDSLITLRFYSLHDDLLRESVTAPKSSNI